MKRISILLFCLVPVLLFTGCGKDAIPVMEVSGTVLYQGKPLEKATVRFHAEDGQRNCSGETDASGVYHIYTAGTTKDGAMPGKYQVAILKVININAPKTMSEEQDDSSAPTIPKKNASLPPVLKNILPEKWGDPKQSGLTAEVVKGKNQFDFTID